MHFGHAGIYKEQNSAMAIGFVLLLKVKKLTVFTFRIPIIPPLSDILK